MVTELNDGGSLMYFWFADHWKFTGGSIEFTPDDCKTTDSKPVYSVSFVNPLEEACEHRYKTTGFVPENEKKQTQKLHL